MRHLGLFVVAFLFLTAFVGAQTAELPRQSVTYVWSTGAHDGAAERGMGKAARLAFQDVIQVAGSPWIQLRFAVARLGPGSAVEITSLADGASQRLDARTLAEWGDSSAYFNGEAVEVRLFVGAQDRGAMLAIEEVVVGEWAFGAKSICGPTDDRVASNEARVARIDPIGCTAWTVDNGKLATAGHCLAEGARNEIVSFQPPLSLPDGTVQFPPPDRQYRVDLRTFQFRNNGRGNDWGFFGVFDNTQTGRQPIQAQGSFRVERSNSATQYRVTGFGIDAGTANQTNQTHFGANGGSSGSRLRYQLDTEPGNSGSPVINTANGRSNGIHSHGDCSAGGGSNTGTSFVNNELWDRLPGQRFSFFEGNNGTQDLVCRIRAVRQQVNFQNDNLSCENDEARSVFLDLVPRDVVLRVFDSPQCSTSDDWTEIRTLQDVRGLTINSFQQSFTANGVRVTHHPHNGLDGKVSCVQVGVCGDGVCTQGPESCSTCSQDCGSCAPPPSCQPTGASCSIFDPPDFCCSGQCVLDNPFAIVGVCGL